MFLCFFSKFRSQNFHCSFNSVKNWFSYQRKLDLRRRKDKKSSNSNEISKKTATYEEIPKKAVELPINYKTEVKKENESPIKQEIMPVDDKSTSNTQIPVYFHYQPPNYILNINPQSFVFNSKLMDSMIGAMLGKQFTYYSSC